nr:hypothetical protein [Tanacetum cinerariifolium]
VVSSDSEGSEADDFSDLKKITALLEINANMVFMTQIEKVLSDSEASSSSADEKISENRVEKANQQSKDFKNQNKDLQDKYEVLKNQTTQGESSSSSLNDDVQQSPKELILPSSNTQSIHINMVPNSDEANTSHNVFNERL